MICRTENSNIDIDNSLLWSETARLNVMINSSGNIYLTSTDASANTPPCLYNLIVNETDTSEFQYQRQDSAQSREERE